MSMISKKEEIFILGAGLVGSLLSIYLSKKGFKVRIIEKRKDPRNYLLDSGRSINLALSHRGLHALEVVGLKNEVMKLAIPMKGRMIHDEAGNTSFLAYSEEGNFINSVSRSELNKMLINEAEGIGVKIVFETRCTRVDVESNKVFLEDLKGEKELEYSLLIGADGAYSALRLQMQMQERFNYHQTYLEHGYKELNIPSINGAHFMDKNSLHIWPRGRFMLIALPNLDGTFTCTLFLPFEGEISFDSLNTKEALNKFFKEVFPDAFDLMPTLENDFFNHKASSLVTVKCFPWSLKNTLLIGDAAHAIVPFYGQGMNAGFEDVRILMEILEKFDWDWHRAVKLFQDARKADTDAIADLANQNFIEMRDLVADPQFKIRKKIENKLHFLYPEKFQSLYSLVSFSDVPYSEALRIGEKQDELIGEINRNGYLNENWENHWDKIHEIFKEYYLK